MEGGRGVREGEEDTPQGERGDEIGLRGVK